MPNHVFMLSYNPDSAEKLVNILTSPSAPPDFQWMYIWSGTLLIRTNNPDYSFLKIGVWIKSILPHTNFILSEIVSPSTLGMMSKEVWEFINENDGDQQHLYDMLKIAQDEFKANLSVITPWKHTLDSQFVSWLDNYLNTTHDMLNDSSSVAARQRIINLRGLLHELQKPLSPLMALLADVAKNAPADKKK